MAFNTTSCYIVPSRANVQSGLATLVVVDVLIGKFDANDFPIFRSPRNRTHAAHHHSARYPQANSQISLLSLVDKVIKSGGVKKSEIILEDGRIIPLDYMLFRYGKGVAALAKANFNRTRALAERFERNELRVLARY